MNNIQKVVAGVLVVVVLSLGMVFPRGNTVVERVVTQFGAVSTLDGVDNPFTSIGGVRTAFIEQSLTATSTKICRIRNPYATSTVEGSSLTIATGILGSNTVSLGTSTAAQAGYATSTTYFVFEHTIATGARDSVNWIPSISTTTNSNLAKPILATGESNHFILNPGEYLVWGLGSTTAGIVNNAYYTGTCSAVIREL